MVHFIERIERISEWILFCGRLLFQFICDFTLRPYKTTLVHASIQGLVNVFLCCYNIFSLILNNCRRFVTVDSLILLSVP